MPNPLEIEILTKYLGSEQAQKAAADLEKIRATTLAAAGSTRALTTSTATLATAVPTLDAATQPYVITTEAEYRAVQKAHDALAARLPVLQAAGKSTADYETSLANLSAVLSTEQALTIAARIETKVDSAAQVEHAEATSLNTVAMREAMVVTRELQAGRLSRLPGSLSILMSQFTEMTPLLNAGLIAGSAAAFLFWGILKKMNEAMEEVVANEAKIQTGVWDDQRKEADAAAEATQKFADKMQAIRDVTANLKTLEGDRLVILNAQLDAQKKILAAQEQAELALAGGDKVKQAEIKARYGEKSSLADLQGEQQKLGMEQDKLWGLKIGKDFAQKLVDKFRSMNVTAKDPKNAENIKMSELEKQTEILKSDKTQGEKALTEQLLKLTGATDYDTAKKKIAEMQTEYDNNQSTPSGLEQSGAGEYGNAGFGNVDLETKLNKAKAARAAVDANKKAIDENTLQIEAHTLHLEMLKKAEDKAVENLTKISGERTEATQKYDTDAAVLDIHKKEVADQESITFKTAMTGLLAPAGTKLNEQMLDAINQVKAMFALVHGSLEVFVNHLKSLHGDDAAQNAAIINELALLQSRLEDNSMMASQALNRANGSF